MRTRVIVIACALWRLHQYANLKVLVTFVFGVLFTNAETITKTISCIQYECEFPSPIGFQ